MRPSRTAPSGSTSEMIDACTIGWPRDLPAARMRLNAPCRGPSRGKMVDTTAGAQGGDTMKRLDTDVVVIGGGSTGLGVVRDAAMRGYRAVLVERVDLGQGTTGRFHGLLHSGGRYVVSDPRLGHRVRRGERDPAPHPGQRGRGHRRLLRHPRRRRPGLRRQVPGGRQSHGRPRHRDLGQGGAPPRAAPRPRHPARHRGGRRLRRRLAARLGRRPLGRGARREGAHVPPGDEDRARRRPCGGRDLPRREGRRGRPASTAPSSSTAPGRGPDRSRRWPAPSRSRSSPAAAS